MPLFTPFACLILLCAQAACVMADQPSPAVVHDLAPSGRLRVAINLGNPVLAQKPPGANGPQGVSADLARELGRRLKLPIEFLTYDAAGKVVAAAREHAWDIAFLAIDPVRADTIAFTHPYVVIEGAYLVPADSPLRTIEAVDQPGVRVAVGRGSAYDLFLTRELHEARRVEAATSSEALEIFLRDKLEVAAGVRQPLALFAGSHPEVRLLPGQFMAIRQAIAFPMGHEAGAHYLNTFIEEMKVSGFVAKALAASGQDPRLAAPQGLSQ